MHQRSCTANAGAEARFAAEAAIEAGAAREQAAREGLPLIVAPHKARCGYKGVMHVKGAGGLRFAAYGSVDGKQTLLGSFKSAEGAALCHARHIGPTAAHAAMERAQQRLAILVMTPEEAVQAAVSEGLPLIRTSQLSSKTVRGCALIAL